MSETNEKRTYHRYEIPRAFLRYKKKGVRGIIRPWQEGGLKNISKGGLSFACGDELAVGDPVNSNLYLPHGVCWPLKGVVAWKGVNQDNESAVGIKFDTVKSGDDFQAKGININAARKLAALHQAAHIVVAYFLGFTPLSVRLDSKGKEDYDIDYGEQSPVAIPLMVEEVSPELFSFYSDMPRKMVFDLAKRLCCILIAGGITENIARLHHIYVGTGDPGFSGPDLYRASAIANHFLVDLIKETVLLYECLKDDRLWDPINRVAADLLENGENRLSGAAIAESLKDSDNYAFLSE